MKLDRMLGIVTLLLQNDRVTAPMLAERFEVSRRTIGRDIDALCQAGIPIVTYQGSGGGIAIADGFRLDKSVLTADELSSILAALKGIGSISSRDSITPTLEKLAPSRDVVLSLQEPIVIDLASHYKGNLTDKITQIKQAVLASRLIQFDYYSEKGQSRRCIEPYFIIFQWASWYVFGYCRTQQDWRLFKLQRLWHLQPTNECFVPRDIPPERRDLNNHFPDNITLVALFDPSTRHQLIETYGLHCYTETPEGLLRLEIGFTNQDYMVSWLLGFGAKVKVLAPADVAATLQQTAKQIYEQYL